MLERWIKNRNLAKKAECKICASARGATTHEPKCVWKQSRYTCSRCKDPHPPSFFNYKKLASLEEEEQVYLAVCIPCEREDSTGTAIKCVGCGVEKNRNQFSIGRQRCRKHSTWRCLECDFPPCKICRAKPDIPKTAPYICERCLFPPCKCGAQRPSSTKYRCTNMKTWTCSKCREEQ